MTLNKTQMVDNLVLNSVLDVTDTTKSWVGTLTDLNKTFVTLAGGGKVGKQVAKALPGSPSALRVVLNRVANRIRTRGVSLKFGRTKDSSRTRYVQLIRNYA